MFKMTTWYNIYPIKNENTKTLYVNLSNILVWGGLVVIAREVNKTLFITLHYVIQIMAKDQEANQQEPSSINS